MKYNENGTVKVLTVKAVNTNIKNEKSTSKQDTYKGQITYITTD